MHEADPMKKIIAPFLIHGICQTEAEALQMLARDYVQRQVKRYAEREAHFRAFYHASVEQFAQQVTTPVSGGRGDRRTGASRQTRTDHAGRR